MISEALRPFLEDLENRLIPEQEEAIRTAWEDFACGRSASAPFIPPKRRPVPAGIPWPKVKINEALANREKMVLRQLSNCSRNLEHPTDFVLWMRPDYGVGTLPSVMGAEKFIMPEEKETLPNVRPLAGGQEAIRALAEAPLPDLNSGFGVDVFAIGELFREIRSEYPKIGRYVFWEHPDCQGPMDICELLWGSDLFLAFYDEPELIHALLRKTVELYKAFLDRWFSILPEQSGFHAYFGRLHRGAITIRNDSAMNLSPALYQEFIFPYDQELLRHFHGGAIHFCGRGDHFLPHMQQTEELYAIDMSQPHLNNMDIILASTIDRGINLFCPGGELLNTAENHCWNRLYDEKRV